jgi:hypothetical protein
MPHWLKIAFQTLVGYASLYECSTEPCGEWSPSVFAFYQKLFRQLLAITGLAFIMPAPGEMLDVETKAIDAPFYMTMTATSLTYA